MKVKQGIWRYFKDIINLIDEDRFTDIARFIFKSNQSPLFPSFTYPMQERDYLKQGFSIGWMRFFCSTLFVARSSEAQRIRPGEYPNHAVLGNLPWASFRLLPTQPSLKLMPLKRKSIANPRMDIQMDTHGSTDNWRLISIKTWISIHGWFTDRLSIVECPWMDIPTSTSMWISTLVWIIDDWHKKS